jgi:hypothetical protein
VLRRSVCSHFVRFLAAPTYGRRSVLFLPILIWITGKAGLLSPRLWWRANLVLVFLGSCHLEYLSYRAMMF